MSEIEEKEINGSIDDNAAPEGAGGESAASDAFADNGLPDADEAAESADVGLPDDEADAEPSSDDSDIELSIDDSGEGIDARRIFEALIFASNEVLTPAKLKALIPGAPDAKRLRKMAADINERLREEGHPFEIAAAGGGYQFRTLAHYHPWVRKLHKERVDKKLSLQALECLAIVAYRQPISKAEVEAVRGVLSDGAMKTLLERKLVDICGRSEKPGRPLLYATTNDFLRYFGINKVTDLPRIEEFEALAKARMEELTPGELFDEKNTDGQDDSNGDINMEGTPPLRGEP